MATQEKKGRGRPKHEIEVIVMSNRIDVDLYEWLKANKGKNGINGLINDIIRKEAGL